MLFKIGDTVYSPNEVPCAVIFRDDEEKETLIKILKGMQQKPNEHRWFTSHPAAAFETLKEFDEWATLSEDQIASMPVTEDDSKRHSL